jgi:hypothetical protein
MLRRRGKEEEHPEEEHEETQQLDHPQAGQQWKR